MKWTTDNHGPTRAPLRSRFHRGDDPLLGDEPVPEGLNAFESATRRCLRTAAKTLPAGVASCLARSRATALGRISAPRRGGIHRSGRLAAACAAVMGLTLLLLLRAQPPQEPALTTAGLSPEEALLVAALVATEGPEDPQIIEELEFHAWLTTHPLETLMLESDIGDGAG
ncbi:MAG TPA: hypothetical protein DCY89_00640 [Gammaproteobacteria bacterium]|nr:hypothetical protein [Gammaproteobacteria bacterium]